MKHKYTVAFIALVGSAIAGGSIAEVGGNVGSRGSVGIGNTSAPSLSSSSRPVVINPPAATAVVIPDARTPSTEISTEYLPGSPAPASILVTKETPVSVAARAKFVVRGANPACTGVSGDAEACSGWQ
jgi:hypothetical protein